MTERQRKRNNQRNKVVRRDHKSSHANRTNQRKVVNKERMENEIDR